MLGFTIAKLDAKFGTKNGIAKKFGIGSGPSGTRLERVLPFLMHNFGLARTGGLALSL